MNAARHLAAVATIDHAAQVAAGLEQVARDIREGKFPVAVRRCLVIVSGPDGASLDGVGMMHFGAETSLAETVGLLELAKIEAIDEA